MPDSPASPADSHPERWTSDLRHAFTGLIRFPPAPAPRWPIATQAALAIALPILAANLLGHHALGLQAATGAFAALFASRMPAIDRVRVVPLVALGLVLSAALGALAGPSPAATLAGLVVVSVGGAAFAFGFALGPPGPLFFVLVFGLSAHVTAAGANGLVLVTAVAAGSAFAWALTAAPLLRGRARAVAPRPLRQLLPGPSWPLPARLLLVRVAIVAVVGTVVGVWIDPERAYWVVGAAVGVIGTAPDRRSAFSRGVHRTAGTVVGAALWLPLALVPWHGAWLAVALGALQFAIELVVVRNYALSLVFITPLVLLLTGAATGDMHSPAIAVERIVDTLAGAVLGAVTGVIHARRRS
jgi:hypothetical protein